MKYSKNYYQTHKEDLYRRATELLKTGMTKTAVAARLNVPYYFLWSVLKTYKEESHALEDNLSR